jgi:thiamine kinase-like enzyme
MLHTIIKAFFPTKTIMEVVPHGNGHINDTYKVLFEGEDDKYILQRINTTVFTNPVGVIENHFKIQQHLEKQETDLEIPSLFPLSDNSGHLYTDEECGVWRIMNFIKDSRSIEIVEEDWQAAEAGAAFGWFANVNGVLKATEYTEAIKDFHRLSFRLQQLNEAIEGNKAGRLDEIQELVDFYKAREEKLMVIEKLVDAGEIPLHVVHNDTKINNLLFRGDKACAVIDLDTVGPGILYYDFGDAIRTISNTAAEDEKDLSKVSFNNSAYKAFAQAYLKECKAIVSPKENSNFYLAPVLMTYIMGIRFLADYLNGDVYYKISFPGQNIARAKVQRKLIECMEANEKVMKDIISEVLN